MQQVLTSALTLKGSGNITLSFQQQQKKISEVKTDDFPWASQRTYITMLTPSGDSE